MQTTSVFLSICVLSRALCCKCSVCCLDKSLPCCSFSDCRNHSVFLPEGLPGHLILGKICLFLFKKILLCLLDLFTLMTARVLWTSSSKASLHDLMDKTSWYAIWHGMGVLQGTFGYLLLSHTLRRCHIFCQMNLLQILLVFLSKSSHIFFQSREKAPMTRGRTCSGEPEAGSDGCRWVRQMVRVMNEIIWYRHARGCVWHHVA